MDIHSKIYKEAMFFQYLFNFPDATNVVKFYLQSRKILMQFFFSDHINKYHDSELLELELGIIKF